MGGQIAGQLTLGILCLSGHLPGHFWPFLGSRASFPFCSIPAKSQTKKPLIRVSEPAPGVHGKGLGEGLAEKVGKLRVGERLTKGWPRVGKGLAKG